MVPDKRCTKCGETKELGEFHSESRAKDGKRSDCIACYRAKKRQYATANRDSARARYQKWYAANKEAVRLYNQEYRRVNSEQIKAYARSPERRAKAVQRVAEWRKSNPTQARALAAQSEAARRARKASAPHEPYRRSDIFARYTGTCAYCDAPAEHLDHVVPISKGGPDAPHNLLPACAPCNLGKSDKSLAEWAATF